jgi:hypothetical protein
VHPLSSCRHWDPRAQKGTTFPTQPKAAADSDAKSWCYVEMLGEVAQLQQFPYPDLSALLLSSQYHTISPTVNWPCGTSALCQDKHSPCMARRTAWINVQWHRNEIFNSWISKNQVCFTHITDVLCQVANSICSLTKAWSISGRCQPKYKSSCQEKGAFQASRQWSRLPQACFDLWFFDFCILTTTARMLLWTFGSRMSSPCLIHCARTYARIMRLGTCAHT